VITDGIQNYPGLPQTVISRLGKPRDNVSTSVILINLESPFQHQKVQYYTHLYLLKEALEGGELDFQLGISRR